ncbi:MucBP domain-containing protein [Lactobacillaceae bacterium L1_55_11]|nr:MucBP domain-containing protein [Lactobacillaceae bacterium L1_55_11]
MTKTAEPLWIYYRNIATGAMLTGPKEVTGTIGTPYEVPRLSFDQLRYVDASGPLAGFLGNHGQSVALFYRPQTWQDCQRVCLYLQILATTAVYQEPSQNRPPLREVAEGSIWATHLRVTTSQGQFWYQIAENQWISFDAEQMKLLDHAEQVANPSYARHNPLQEMNQSNAVIDFLPGQKLDTYDQPYGMPDRQVSDGDFVTIDKKLTDDLDVTWGHIKNVGWLNDIYLKHF